jgi:integrase
VNGHIRPRSPGSFELRYRVGAKTVTTTFRGGKRDAERELRRLLRLVDENQHPNDPDRLTLAQWLERWLGQVRGETAPQTHLRYESVCRVHIVPALGEFLLTRVGVSDVQSFYSALASGTDLSARSRKNISKVLTNALNRAVEQRLIATSPAQALKKRLPRVEQAEMRVLDQAQSQQLLAFARSDILYPAIFIALATGARRGEILALTWSRVDFDRSSIRISESVEQIASSIRMKPPKSGTFRTVDIGSAVLEELRRLKVEQAEALLALGIRQTTSTLVCCRPDGAMLTPSQLSDNFRKTLIRKSGLPRVRFHDLRHSHASQLLAAGVNIKVVAERLGHADPAITLRVYSHLMPGAQAEAAARIDAIFRPQ